MKFGLLKYGVCTVMLLLFLGTVNVNATGVGALFAENSIDPTEFEMFSQNNISFYDPTDCLSSGNGGHGASVLSGNTIEEKIWNYFVQAGIPGVSDDAAVIAGIMGNLYTESGYNPFMRGSNLKYRALWMLMDSYNGKQYASKLASDINSAVGGNYWKFYGWWGSIDDADKKLASAGVPQSAIDTAITMELDYLTKSEEYKSDWDGFVNNFDWVTNKTPSGYSDLFLVKVERAVNGGSPIADPGVRSHVKGSYQGSAKRRAAAEDVYNRLAGVGGASGASLDVAGGSTSSSSSISDVNLASVTTEVTLIGDSISVFSESELMKKFPNSFLNKVGSRHSTSGGACSGDEGGLSILRKIVQGSGTILNQHQGKTSCESVNVDSSALKENVVWALGTNSNGADEKTLNSVLELVGKRKLFLVAPFNNSSQYLPNSHKTYKEYTDEIAEMYRNFADSHDNVYLIDWNKEVRDNVSTYILSDNVHPTTVGTELFAKLIAEAVSGSKDCTTYSGDLPQYSQGDPKWSSLPYGGSTIGKAGCGPSSLAMLVTAATGKDVLPTDIAELTNGCAYFSPCGFMGRRTNTEKVCEKYGCETMVLSDSSEETIRQALKDGWMIHLSGHGSKGDGTTNSFQSNGHYIGYYSIDENDNVMVVDSAGYNNPNRRNRKMALRDAIRGRWEDGRPIMAIRGQGGNVGKNTCDVVGNYCASDGSGSGGDNGAGGASVEGGLTKEQAQILADLYNNDPTTNKSKGNCPEIVKWFMKKFTDIGHPGTSGNGQDVAYNMATRYSLGHGDAPRPYSAFSTLNSRLSAARCGHCHGGKYGHTGIVLGVNGDKIITLETYGRAKVMEWNASIIRVPSLAHPDYVYAYYGDHMDMNKLSKAIGGL